MKSSRERRKSCPRGTIMNPETKRCVKRSGSIGKRVIERNRKTSRRRRSRDSRSCPRGKIMNPETNRCVKRSGIIGKRLGERSKEMRRSKKRRSKDRRGSCPRGKITNPQTGRCVKKSGSIGKRIIDGDKERDVASDLSKEHRENINHIVARKYSNALFEELADLNPIFERPLGKGGYGQVYTGTIEKDGKLKDVVIKIMKENEGSSSKYEYEIQSAFKNAGILVPRPILYTEFVTERGDTFAIIIMDLDEYTTRTGVFQRWLEKKQPENILDLMLKTIDLLLSDMCANNFIHGDFHWGNIGFQNTSPESTVRTEEKFKIEDKQGRPIIISPLLIDFGWASKGKCRPDFEILQLIRTLQITDKGEIVIQKDNRKYLENGLLQLLEKYKSRNPYYIDTIEDYGKLRNFKFSDELHDEVHRKQYSPEFRRAYGSWERSGKII